jgi:hypothetical protein
VANIASSGAQYNANAPIGENAEHDLQAGVSRFVSTPSGVGLSQKPRAFLGVGDSVSLGIEGLGEQRQRVVASR